MTFQIRDFRPNAAAAVNAVAEAAFYELRDAYDEWDTISHSLRNRPSLAECGELIVATAEGEVVGAVTYVGPRRPKKEFFPAEWPIVRMLVVAPSHRGLGIGRALTEKCIRRAERDGASLIALHTSPVMRIALPMYLRMGFEYQREAPALYGVPYGIYVKPLLRTRARDESLAGGSGPGMVSL